MTARHHQPNAADFRLRIEAARREPSGNDRKFQHPSPDGSRRSAKSRSRVPAPFGMNPDDIRKALHKRHPKTPPQARRAVLQKPWVSSPIRGDEPQVAAQEKSRRPVRPFSTASHPHCPPRPTPRPRQPNAVDLPIQIEAVRREPSGNDRKFQHPSPDGSRRSAKSRWQWA